MSWALPHVVKLQRGETVQFRPRGASMRGKIESGQLVTVEPVSDPKVLKIGDIVLCMVKSKYFLHMIVNDRHGMHEEFLIGNMRRYMNGWTTADKIYGKVTKIEP